MQIGKYTIKLKESLGWYDLEQVKSSTISGAKMDNTGLRGFDGQAVLDAKLKLWELAIIEIKEGDKVIPFSLKWVQELTPEEGDLLDSEVAQLDKKK